MVLPQDDANKDNPTQSSEGHVSPLPTWLKSESPPGDVQAAQPMPDWLKASNPGPTPSPSRLPDWLPAEARPLPSARPEQMPSRSPEPVQKTREDVKPAEPQDDLSALRASMGPPDAGEMPDWLADAAPSEPATADMPDWLAEVSSTEQAAPSSPAETPDWLSTVMPGEPASGEPATVDMPDWLAEVSSTEQAAPSSPAETPDWLSTVMPGEPASGEPATVDMPDWLAEVSSTEQAAPSSPAETPDWLSGAPPAEPAAPSLEPSAAIPAEALDWLADVPPAELASAGMSDLIKQAPPTETGEPTTQPPEPVLAAPAEPGSADMPDWLVSALETPAQSSEATPSASAEMPDWLSSLEPAEMPVQPAEPIPAVPAEAPDWLGSLDAAEPPAQPAEPTPAAPAEAPDWLGSLGAAEPSVEPAALPSETAIPATSSDAKEWLSGLAPLEPAAEPAQAAEPDTTPQLETADWLSSLEKPSGTTSESVDPLLAEPVGGSSSSTEQAADDLFDWLNIDMDLPVAASTTTGSGEDLLGLTSDLQPPSAEQIEVEGETVEEPAAETEGLPEWWQSVQPAASAPWEETSGTSSDLLDQISGLRFDTIVGSGSQAGAAEPEKVGALKDVVGVIQPEVVFEGGSLAAGGMGVESVITDDQNRRIERLKRLLDAEQKETPISAERQMALPLVRWLVTVLLIAAIAAPVVMGIKLLPEPQVSSNATEADQLLSALPDASTVLIAFEYEPEAAAELQPLAVTLLKRIGGRNDMTVYAVSTKPTGPAMADQAMKKAFPSKAETTPDAEAVGSDLTTPDPVAEVENPVQEKSGWINLGYLPGGANGISELVLGSPHGLPSRLVFDYQGHSTGITQAGLLEQPPALMVIVTARAEDLRPWVEQAGQVMNTPMLVVASAGSSPLALPYRQSGQVNAVLIGVGDTLSYQSLTESSPDQALVATWNAQALGSLSAVLAIIVGGVFYGLASWRKQQEQSR